ncbi:hypothetical protein E2C01_030978 [Portunus trituberculatus]|uniref:Uncharacterized protein n=1 Tax=Portunus trituberculatus TaxID=210409 RepID=A0A5B7EWD2_PORTR|nr:hypothetical protein [Portunus trituberculatus]
MRTCSESSRGAWWRGAAWHGGCVVSCFVRLTPGRRERGWRVSSKSLVTDLRFRKTLKYTLAGVTSAGLTQVCLLFACLAFIPPLSLADPTSCYWERRNPWFYNGTYPPLWPKVSESRRPLQGDRGNREYRYKSVRCRMTPRRLGRPSPGPWRAAFTEVTHI